jgi:hypothetical protein
MYAGSDSEFIIVYMYKSVLLYEIMTFGIHNSVKISLNSSEVSHGL